jgi:long-chain acyl-CoA synthetase
MINYLELFTENSRKYWNEKALCDWRGDAFTFGDVANRIKRIHILFKTTGISKGDKVTVCAPNSARWAVSFLASNTYGTVTVPLLSDFTPDAICHLVDHSESVALFTDKDTFSKLDVSRMPRLKFIVCTGDFSLLWAASEEYEAAFNGLDKAFAAKYPEGLRPEDIDYKPETEDTLAIINYTSGTTSAPKGVMLKYKALSTSIDFAIRYIPADKKDSIVSMLPMGHIYGMVFEFLYPLSCGVTVYYLGKAPAASTLLKAMADVKPYIVITVPLVMEKVYNNSIKPVLSKWYMKVLTSIPGVKKVIYKKVVDKILASFGGNVQQFIMGGAALNPDVEKAFHRMGLPYSVGYGMTEAAPLLAFSNWWLYVPGSCGKHVDSAEVRIDSPDPENVIGEIQAKGSNICMGYFNNPEASQNAFTEDGFLRTGDLGVMDKDGNVFIKGRCKTMILSANGQNIFPEEIEAVLNSIDFVGDSVVVDRHAKLVALITLDKEAIRKAGLDDASVAELPEKVRVKANRTLPVYSKITKVEVKTEPFEKTPKGSIKRFLYS